MILPDFMIKEYAQQGMIEPFEPKYINPASLDLTLYGEIIEITPGGVIDASNSGSASNRLTTQKRIQLQYGQKYLLQPGIFILASSIEVLNLPHNLAANVQLKSTTARSGIGHVYAGWIDPGFSGQITFELFSHVPVLLEPGKPVCQITFLQMAAIPEKPYQGKYQNQQGPTPARQLSFEALVEEPIKKVEFPGLEKLFEKEYQQRKPESNKFIGLDASIEDFLQQQAFFPNQTVMPPGIDQIWSDFQGNMYVKTPNGLEFKLGIEIVRGELAKGQPLRSIIANFVSGIINTTPKELDEMGLDEAIEHTNTVTQEIIQAIKEDFSIAEYDKEGDTSNPKHGMIVRNPPEPSYEWKAPNLHESNKLIGLDASTEELLGSIKDTWSKRPIPKIDRDWGEEE